MTDHRSPGDEISSIAKGPVEKPASNHLLAFGQGAQESPFYGKKDIETMKQFEADAEKLLGKLDIDHSGGVSRKEIQQKETQTPLTAHEKQIYDALKNLEPTIQEAWQVPDHRHHLQAHSDADFYRDAAKLMLKKGDDVWADELTTEAAKVDGPAKKLLAEDRVMEREVYFNQGGVNQERLNALKEQIANVDAAARVLPMTDKVAKDLLRRFDDEHKGLTVGDLAKLGADKHDKRLSTTDRAVINGIVDFEKPFGKDTKLTLTEIKEAVRYWIVKELRSDSGSAEQLFARALNGYQGKALDIRKEELFNREMDYKDGSQLAADERAHNYTRVPHFPKS